MRKRTLHRLLSEGLACVWRKGGTQRGAVGVASVPRATAPFVHSVHLRVRSIVFWRENQSRCDLKNGKLQDITREKGHGVPSARCQSSTMPSAKAEGQLPTEMQLPIVLPRRSVGSTQHMRSGTSMHQSNTKLYGTHDRRQKVFYSRPAACIALSQPCHPTIAIGCSFQDSSRLAT